MLPGRVVAYVQYRDREQAMALVGATKPDLKTAAAKVSECEAQKTQLEVQGNGCGHQETLVLTPRVAEELPGGSLADAMLPEIPSRRGICSRFARKKAATKWLRAAAQGKQCRAMTLRRNEAQSGPRPPWLTCAPLLLILR